MITEQVSESVIARRQRNQRNRFMSSDVRDVGVPPEIVDAKRRQECKSNLRLFMTTYFADAFYLPFGDDHESFIADVAEVIRKGGQLQILMPRGSGKTTILQRSIIWAALYGHSRFPMLVAADKPAADALMLGIRTVLETAPLLLEDFPEVIHPILALENIGHRCRGQTSDGEPTRIQWGKDTIQFPQTKQTRKAGNAGIAIRTAGLTGSGLRGSNVVLADGSIVRPDLVLIDDPQTRLTAKSPVSNQTREDLLNSDIIGMSGPTQKMSCLMSATVIYDDDLCSRIFDRVRNPHWKSRRVSMIKSWPTNTKRWDEWDAIRRQELFTEVEEGSATAFYKSNRKAMDEGFSVYWDQRIDPGCVSAFDSAMTRHYNSPSAFASEFQNQPQDVRDDDFVPLNPLSVAKRVSSLRRQLVPDTCERIVAHVDVQKRMLFYVVCGVTNDMGMYVIDYGTWPKHPRKMFDYRSTKVSLQQIYKGESDETCVRIGVEQLITALNSMTYVREDHAHLGIDRGLVDVGYMQTEVEAGLVASKARNWRSLKGVGVTAYDQPLIAWKKWKGTRGEHLIVQKPKGRTLLCVRADVNYWKSQAHSGLSVPVSHPEAVILFNDHASSHQMIAEHFCAEEGERNEHRGNVVEEWPTKSRENHYWDNLIGCYVAASLCGVEKAGRKEKGVVVKRPAKRISIRV